MSRSVGTSRETVQENVPTNRRRVKTETGMKKPFIPKEHDFPKFSTETQRSLEAKKHQFELIYIYFNNLSI